MVAVLLLAAPPIQGCGSETKGMVLWQPSVDDGGGDATTASPADAASDDAATDDVAIDDAAPSDGPDMGDGDGAGFGAVDACGFDGGHGNVIVLGGLTVSQQHGGATTGTQFIDECPPNQAVIGYRGFLTSPDSGLIGDFGLPAIVIGGIETVCGALGVGGPSSNEIVTAFSMLLPMRGNAQDSAWMQLCPPNEVVIRFSGRSGLALDQVAFECGHWSMPKTCDSPSVDRTTTTLTPAGGNGGTAYRDGCPAGKMATGSVIRAGKWVDSLGIFCESPSLGSDGG